MKLEKLVDGVVVIEIGTVMYLLSVSLLIELEHELKEGPDEDD